MASLRRWISSPITLMSRCSNIHSGWVRPTFFMKFSYKEKIKEQLKIQCKIGRKLNLNMKVGLIYF